MNKFTMSLVGLAVAIGGILLFNYLGTDSNAALPRDCDNNSIISCGAITPAELAKHYNENKKGDLDNIYAAYGLSSYDMNHAGTVAKSGHVHKDGRITVGGVTVATNAHSIGRQNITSGSTSKYINSVRYYEHTPSMTFARESIVAYVFFDAKGDFRAAVLTSCGNPVSAKKPVYKCDSLTKSKISRTKYEFTSKATAKDGAVILGYNYNFGDGSKTTSKNSKVTHEYSKPGTYTVKMSVNIKVSGKNKAVTASQCETKVVVETPPPTPVYSCDQLTFKKISRLEYEFTSKATAKDGAVILGYNYNFGDGSKTTSKNSKVTHEYSKPGTYTVKMSVNIKVSGKVKAIPGSQCETKVVVETPPPTPVYSCDQLTFKKISRLEYEFTGKATAEGGATISSYTLDYGDGKSEAMANPTNIKHTYDKDGKYTAKLSVAVKVDGTDKPVTSPACEVQITVDAIVTPPEECKPGIPVGDERCTEAKKVVAVTELPKTGPMNFIGGALGLGSLVAASYYYYASRRGLIIELLKQR